MRGLMAAKAMRTRKGVQIEFEKRVNDNNTKLVTLIEIQNTFYKKPININDVNITQTDSLLNIAFSDINIKLKD